MIKILIFLEGIVLNAVQFLITELSQLYNYDYSQLCSGQKAKQKKKLIRRLKIKREEVRSPLGLQNKAKKIFYLKNFLKSHSSIAP